MGIEKTLDGGKLGGFRYRVAEHLSDATSISAISAPIKAVTDQLSGMSDAESIGSRIDMIKLNYLGFVQLLRIRDWSKRKFGIDKISNKLPNYVHDAAFTLCVAMPIQAGVYMRNGVDSWKEMFATLGLSALVLGVFGGPLGQGIDGFRELMGVKESMNSPHIVKRISKKYRKAVGVGVVAASLALTAGLYHFIPNRASEARPVQPSSIERMVDYNPDVIYSERVGE